jgi:hypothetical protein
MPHAPEIRHIRLVKDHMELRKLTARDVTFTLHAEEEDVGPKDHFLPGDTGMPLAEYEEMIGDIRKRLRRGDRWAFCKAVVTASWGLYSASATLGRCSFESEADFRAEGGVEQMEEDALKALNDKLAGVLATLAPLL